MYCANCGNSVRDGARFCDQCGAVQPEPIIPESQKPKAEPVVIQPVLPGKKPQKPKKERKKVNKKLLAVIAAVLVVAVTAAVVIPFFFPGKETVYVLTSCTIDGKTVCEYTYDEFGNPLELRYMGRQYRLRYDRHGNLKERTVILSDSLSSTETFDFSYDSKGRIEECEIAHGNVWEFTWDKKGNLIRAELDEKSPSVKPYGGCVRADFHYDSKGRLFRECYIYEQSADRDTEVFCRVILLEYTYDRQGKLLAIDSGRSKNIYENSKDIDPEDIDCDLVPLYTLEYDSKGRLTALENCAQNSTFEYSYDEDGNYLEDDDDTFIYDEHGNLIRIEWDAGGEIEYTYEEVEMTHEAAQRYRRWESIYRLDPKKEMLYPYADTFHPGYQLFFYYLVPSPVW